MDILAAQVLVNRFNAPGAAPELDIVINELIDSPSSGYIIIDINGIITHINQTYLNIIGKKRKEVIGQPIMKITPIQDSRKS